MTNLIAFDLKLARNIKYDHVSQQKICFHKKTGRNQVGAGDEKHFDWVDICGSFVAKLTVKKYELCIYDIVTTDDHQIKSGLPFTGR